MNPPPSTKSPGVQLLGLVVSFLLCFAVAGVGGWASLGAPSFYAALTRPSWAPPSWLFGPVWTLLYLMMASAAWLVWRVGPTERTRNALSAFAVQLALNAAWPWTFFSWHSGRISTVIILLLWALILFTTRRFWSIGRPVGALLLPYGAWVTYAAVLNVALWRANPDRL